MSDTESSVSLERFIDGLKRAASRARELGKAQQNPAWNKLAHGLDTIRINGTKQAEGKCMTRADVLDLLDVQERKMII